MFANFCFCLFFKFNLIFFLIYCASLQECWVDAGSIDVHCVVVVYEFLCGWWCVLNRSGSQQTALITSDTPVSHLRLPRAPAFPACCLPCTSACKIRKHRPHFEKEKRLHGKAPVMHSLLFAAVVRKCVVSSGLGSFLILKTLACYSSLCNSLESFIRVMWRLRCSPLLHCFHNTWSHTMQDVSSQAALPGDVTHAVSWQNEKGEGCRGCTRIKGRLKRWKAACCMSLCILLWVKPALFFFLYTFTCKQTTF